MAYRTILTDEVPEGSACRIAAVLLDEDGAAIDGGNLSALDLTLYVRGSGVVLNTRDSVPITGSLGGCDASGNLSINLSAADNVMNDTGVVRERHAALIEWTYANRSGKSEVWFDVVNLRRVND